jgi:hypothetical protein
MTPSELDPQKRAYFVSRYRDVSEDELREAAARMANLADEAADALRQVLAERGVKLEHAPAPPVKPMPEPGSELSPEDRTKQTQLATDLWNSSSSKHVQYMFGFHALVLMYTFLGPAGLRVGGIPLFLALAAMTYALSRVGRQYTRHVCANAERTIDEKRSSLTTATILLWLGSPVTAILGTLAASAVRGA